MKVYTHYPALAPAIRRAGYEPALLEPLVCENGPVGMVKFMDTIIVAHPMCPPLHFMKDPSHFGCWAVLP